MNTSEKLLRTLLRVGAASRADLAKMLHLSRPAVSSTVELLLGNGMLCEGECGESNGRKPPILLEFNTEHLPHVIGIDIGHESLLRGVLCNGAGEKIAVSEAAHDNTFDSILDSSAGLVQSLAARSANPVCGVGCAVAGQVDYSKNEVVSCSNFPLKERSLASCIAEQCHLPVLLDNRARLAAQWEYFYGAARQAEDFIFISAERGIGTATYHGGKIFTGRSGHAGEIRDLLVPVAGEGMMPVEQAMSEKFLAQRRDPIHDLLKTSSYIITLLSELLDPALIVLGGRFRDYGEEFFSTLSGCIHLDPERPLHISPSQSGRIGAALGAALNIVLTDFANGSKNKEMKK